MKTSSDYLPSGGLELPKLSGNVKSANELLKESLSQEYGALVDSETKSRKKRYARRMMLPPYFLEPLIREGFPRGSNISLLGPPGVGKTIFCESLALHCLRNGGSCLYVTLDKSPDDVRHSFKELRTGVLEKEPKKRLVFVDGFSWLVGKSQEDYHVENLGNLTELSIRIASAACDLANPILLIFDSVSPLLVYNPENVVVKFLQILLARIKDWKSMGFYVVQEGVHSDEFCNTLGYLVDGIFEMKMDEEEEKIRRYFRIRSLKFMSHETKWMPFVIQTNRRFILNLRRRKTK